MSKSYISYLLLLSLPIMTAVTITEIAPTSSPTSVLRVCETKGKGYNQQVVLYYHMLENECFNWYIPHNMVMILKNFIGNQIYATVPKVAIHCTIITVFRPEPHIHSSSSNTS